MTDRKRILAIDDDVHVLEVVRRYFSAKGYEVRTSDDGREAVALATQSHYDVVLLDLNMPGMDGFAVCREIRQRSDVPIIFLTAEAEETEKVIGLELGADDYVTKPFSTRELEARVKAVLRRRVEPEPEPAKPSGRKLTFDGLTLDLGRRELRDRDGELISLTGGEYRLLKAFVDHPNRVLSRDQLMDWTKGREAAPFDRSIDVQVGRLRKKLGDEGPNYRLIKTFRGEGYILSVEVT